MPPTPYVILLDHTGCVVGNMTLLTETADGLMYSWRVRANSVLLTGEAFDLELAFRNAVKAALANGMDGLKML